MALRTRADYYDGIDCGIRSEELARTSRLVSRLTGYPVQYNKAVVGRNAFAHEAGHPPARRAQRAQHLRDHGPGRGRARASPRSCSASTPGATPSPTR